MARKPKPKRNSGQPSESESSSSDVETVEGQDGENEQADEDVEMKPPAEVPEEGFPLKDDDSVDKEFPLHETLNPINGTDVEDHIEKTEKSAESDGHVHNSNTGGIRLGHKIAFTGTTSEKAQLRTTLEAVLGFTWESITLIMDEEGMSSLADYRSFPIDMFPTLATKVRLNLATLKRLRIFCAWLDRQPHGMKTWAFTTTVLKKEIDKGPTKSDSRRDDQKATAPMPDKFGGAPGKWTTFKSQFEAYVNSLSEEYTCVLSHSRKRYQYDSPAGTQADAMAKDVDSLFLHDNNRKRRNKAVFNILKSLTSDGDAYTHVLEHEIDQDGRAAWISLCAFYEGTANLSITVEEARIKLEQAKYTGGKGNFQKYLTTHLQGHALMARNPEISTSYSDFHKRNLLFNGIKVTELQPSVEVARANETWAFAKVVNFLRTAATNFEMSAKREERLARFNGGKNDGKKGKRQNKKRRNEGDDDPKGNQKKRKSGLFSRAPSGSLHPSIWAALSDEAKAEIRKSREDAKRVAKAAKTDSRDGSKNSESKVNGYTTNSRSIIVDELDAQEACPGQSVKKQTDTKHQNPHKTPKTVCFEKNSTGSLESNFVVADEPKPKGAGFRFGRRGRVARMLKTSALFQKIGHTSRILDVKFREEFYHRIRQNKRIETETHGEMWVDTGADTCCVGRGFKVLAETDRYVTLRGYSDRSDEEEKVPIVTAATAMDLADGTTVILIFNEALYLGNKQYTSLLNLNQIRHAGHQADDIPLFLSQGSSIHGIKTLDDVNIPFTLKGRSSLLYVRTPTSREMEDCEHIELTSEEPWDPNEDDWEENEQKFTRKFRNARCTFGAVNEATDEGLTIFDSREQAVIDDMLSELPEVRSAQYVSRALKSGNRSENLNMNRLRRIFGGISEEIVNKTLSATTHMIQRSAAMPIHKRYKTKFAQLRYRRLKCTLYSDTFDSNVTSTRGNTKTQGFVCGNAFFCNALSDEV